MFFGEFYNPNKNAHIIWAFLFGFAFYLSLKNLSAQAISGYISVFFLYLLYFLYANNTAITRYKWFFFATILIFFHTLLNSIFLARSVLLANQICASFFLFCCLYDFESEGEIKQGFIKTVNLILIAFALLQASALIHEYAFSMKRSVGLFLDYSQASFFILICFLLSIKESAKSRFWHLYVLVLFIGIFTSYSRTSNFLLVFLICLLTFFSIKIKSSLVRPSTIITVLIAFLIVHFYPSIFGSESVDRGGLSQLSTLNSRTHYWGAAIDAIKNNPLWGTGMGTYEFLGIKSKIPTHLINAAHNDYLDTWVSLGLFWLIALITTLGYILIKHCPLTLTLKLKTYDNDKIIAWSLLTSITLYMLINFLLFTLTFQILIAIILSRVLKNE